MTPAVKMHFLRRVLYQLLIHAHLYELYVCTCTCVTDRTEPHVHQINIVPPILTRSAKQMNMNLFENIAKVPRVATC